MRRMSWIVAAALLFMLLEFACPPANDAQDKVITLSFSDMFPPDNKIGIYMSQWCKEVEKRTNGRVKVTLYSGSTLTPATQTYAGVIKGIADIGLSFHSYTKGRFPLTEVIDLPLGYKSAAVGGRMINEYLKKFKPKEFDDVKPLFFYTTQPHRLFTKKPINSLEDLKGVKIRATGTTAAVAKALGGLPVAMPITEAYDSLSRGVVQGISINYEPMKGWKLAEVVSYCTEYSSAYAHAFYVVMNKARWNALPGDIQKIIEKINEEWVDNFGALWDELEKEGKDTFVQKGGKTIILSKEEDARWTNSLRPLLDEFVQEKKAMGLPAEEALKFCMDYLKTH
jgi:TRAP-type C4-dicarboxylate transport system substrate-binding protein